MYDLLRKYLPIIITAFIISQILNYSPLSDATKIKIRFWAICIGIVCLILAVLLRIMIRVMEKNNLETFGEFFAYLKGRMLDRDK